MATQRLVAHLDMDAFYASVELLRYPELRGQPVVIGGRSIDQPTLDHSGKRCFARLQQYSGRGVITTSTYEARALGVFSGMGLMKAAKLAPQAILLPVDFDAYRHYSRLFKQAVTALTPTIEDRGIDEIYIDLSAYLSENIYILAQTIKQAVYDATGLTCSIGIAPNKLLAKICSDLNKPNGITVLRESDIPEKIWPLSVKKINGIGPKTTQKLADLGIISIADLAKTELSILRLHFGGNYAMWLHRVSHGLDERPVTTYSEPKSISRETTFEQDLHVVRHRDQLSAIFTRLCHSLASDLEKKGYVCRTISIKLRFDDFSTITRDITLDASTAEATLILQAARECLRRISLKQKIRLLGVKASTLSKKNDIDLEEPPLQSLLPLIASE
ncbi:MAG: DNA polymerase IV [Pseudomonadota bacterium]